MSDQDRTFEPSKVNVLQGQGEGVSDRPGTSGAADHAQPEGLTGQVKQQVASTLAGQKDGVADRIDDVAESLQRTSEQFAGKQDWISGAIERGASELSSLAGSLREADLTDLLGEVRTFARRQPGLFIGASLAAGFAVARFAKIAGAGLSRDDLPNLPEVGCGQQ
jgi:hypothetical protein